MRVLQCIKRSTSEKLRVSATRLFITVAIEERMAVRIASLFLLLLGIISGAVGQGKLRLVWRVLLLL